MTNQAVSQIQKALIIITITFFQGFVVSFSLLRLQAWYEEWKEGPIVLRSEDIPFVQPPTQPCGGWGERPPGSYLTLQTASWRRSEWHWAIWGLGWVRPDGGIGGILAERGPEAGSRGIPQGNRPCWAEGKPCLATWCLIHGFPLLGLGSRATSEADSTSCLLLFVKSSSPQIPQTANSTWDEDTEVADSIKVACRRPGQDLTPGLPRWLPVAGLGTWQTYPQQPPFCSTL